MVKIFIKNEQLTNLSQKTVHWLEREVPDTEIPFDVLFRIETNEIIQLEINREGVSPHYLDSYFECETIDNYFLCKRHKIPTLTPIALPQATNQEDIVINNFRQFQFAKENDALFPPLFALENFPEETLIGSGHSGQVHLIFQGETKRALKLLHLYHECIREYEIFTFDEPRSNDGMKYVKPLDEIAMHCSFEHAYQYYVDTRLIPHHKNISKITGLAYIKASNQWGCLFEYVEGYSFDYFCDNLGSVVDGIKIVDLSEKTTIIYKIAIELAEGLKVLDESGCAHTDLLNPNILINKMDYRPVIIDYDKHRFSTLADSLDSRCQYGKRLAQLGQVCGDNDPGLKALAEALSDQTIPLEKLSWELAIHQLKNLSIHSDSIVTVSEQRCKTIQKLYNDLHFKIMRLPNWKKNQIFTEWTIVAEKYELLMRDKKIMQLRALASGLEKLNQNPALNLHQGFCKLSKNIRTIIGTMLTLLTVGIIVPIMNQYSSAGYRRTFFGLPETDTQKKQRELGDKVFDALSTHDQSLKIEHRVVRV